ncbi:SSU1 Sulfite efflux pump SSU1 [Candida maltosa Xu316]
MLSFLYEELIENFHPVFFVSFLGTGITGNIFYGFPYPARWLEVLGIICFCLTITFFFFTTGCFIISLYYYPKRWYQYQVDQPFSIYFAVYSMGYNTIINGIHLITHGRFPIFLWVLWWIGVAFALYNTIFLFYWAFLSKLNKHNLDAITGVALMPVVCPCVVSSSGHLISPYLPNDNLKTITEITCLMLLFISLTYYHGVGAIYLSRLILHKTPSTELVFTTFLPVGFTGQSSYSIMLFGANMYEFIPDKSLGQAFLVTSAMISTFFLASGYVFLFLAIVSVFSKIKPFTKKPNPKWTTKKLGLIKWNKGFWIMTFPIGTMSLANFEISKGIIGGYQLEVFRVMAAIFGACLFLICFVNLIGLSWRAIQKTIKAYNQTTDVSSMESKV